MDYMKIALDPSDYHETRLRVPARQLFQLVFRQKRELSFQVSIPGDLAFGFVDGLGAWWRHKSSIVAALGMPGALKAALKVMRGRQFYFIRDSATVLHTGWLLSSWCRYYLVQQGDVVIGPIWSSDASRNRGVGSLATKLAMNAMIERGSSVFFIDTTNDNLPCLKLIQKCEFGFPVASYLR